MFSSKLPVKQTWDLSTRVEAKAKGWKKFYWGVIEAFDAKDGTYTVKFEDGEIKTGVKEYNIKGPKKTEVFTAPDGTVFNDKQSYRRYLAETMYTFKDKENETLVKLPGEIDGQTFNLVNLKGCEVRLMDHSDQVLIDGVENCKILVGPSCESVFVRNATNCQLFIACKQFRSRDCKDVTISLYTKTEPIVETSTNMKFYPYSCSYPGQTAHFSKARLIPDHNHWCNVFDFNAGDSSIPMPHWSLIPETAGWPSWELAIEDAAPENPVPKSARAVPMERDQCFSFGVTQDQAQQAAEKTASNTTSEQVDNTPSPIPPTIPSNPNVSQVETKQNDTAPSTATTFKKSAQQEDTVVFSLQSSANGVAVISGGASGIGLSVARKCAQAGLKVAIADNNQEKLTAAASSLKEISNSVIASNVDVSNVSEVVAFENQIRTTFTDSDIVFVLNNAAVMGTMSVLNSTTQEVHQLLNTNVVGVVNFFQAFIPNLAKQDDNCTIVTSSSIAGLVPIPTGMYTATKYAVTGITECVAREVRNMEGGNKINIHMLCPSFVATPLWTSSLAKANSEDQLVQQAIYNVTCKKGLTSDVVADTMFEGLKAGKFAILVDNPGSEGELSSMLEARTEDIVSGTIPRSAMAFQKLSQDIQQAIQSSGGM